MSWRVGLLILGCIHYLCCVFWCCWFQQPIFIYSLYGWNWDILSWVILSQSLWVRLQSRMLAQSRFAAWLKLKDPARFQNSSLSHAPLAENQLYCVDLLHRAAHSLCESSEWVMKRGPRLGLQYFSWIKSQEATCLLFCSLTASHQIQSHPEERIGLPLKEGIQEVCGPCSQLSNWFLVHWGLLVPWAWTIDWILWAGHAFVMEEDLKSLGKRLHSGARL